MEPTKHICLELIDQYGQKLDQMSGFDENTIRDIWRKDDESWLNDFSNLEYTHNNMPLYFKMIFRFWNYNRMVSTFYRGITWFDQDLFLRHYCVSRDEVHELMEFFAWITNTLTVD